jgi:HAD-superfamily hydrolase, subfamily IIB
MKHISEITPDILKDIKLIVFDVDGVLVPRGTNIKQDGRVLTIETKVINENEILGISGLHNLDFNINISSGRSLTTLMEMFRPILHKVSLTFENGSATWIKGNIVQHINSYDHLSILHPILSAIKDENIKGFEPKEHIITVHAHDRVRQIDNLMDSFDRVGLYCLWNGEAYDFGVKEVQTKGKGVEYVYKHLGLEKKNVMAIGDNYNDKELLEAAGLAITADKDRVQGDYWVELDRERLPASILIHYILVCLASKNKEI